MIAPPSTWGATTRRRVKLLAGAFAVVSTTVVACRPVTAPATRSLCPPTYFVSE